MQPLGTYLAMAELRRHWRGAVLLAVLVGLAGGVVLATVAGARRSASADERYRAAARSGDVTLFHPRFEADRIDRLRRLPEVEAVAPIVYFVMQPAGAEVAGPEVQVAASRDGRWLRDIDRPLRVDGRLAATADEMALGRQAAETLDVGIGDTVEFETVTAESYAEVVEGGRTQLVFDGPRVHLTVVGVVSTPFESVDEERGLAMLSPAFVEERAADLATFFPASIRLRGGTAAFDSFAQGANEIYENSPELFLESAANRQARTDDAIRVVVIGLLAFAGVAAVAGAVAIGTALSRWLQQRRHDQQTLGALGVSRTTRAAALVLTAVPVAVGGTVLSVLLAVAASPLFPLDPARSIEPTPGFDVDGMVLVVGGVAVLLATLGLSGLLAFRTTRAAAETPAPSGMRSSVGITRVASALGSLPSAASGVRMALEPGRGATAVPVRPALVGTVVGVLGVVATLTFGASLFRLVEEPALSGWNWDVQMSGIEGTPSDEVVGGLGQDVSYVAGVDAVSALRMSTADIGGTETQLLGFQALRGGGIAPTVLEGRAAQAPDEVVLGSDTMERLGVTLGDRAPFPGLEGAPVELEVVGRGVFATQADTLDEGAALTMEGLEQLDAYVGTTELVVRWAPEADVDAGLAELTRLSASRPLLLIQPSQVRDLERVESLPVALAGFLALLAALAVGHALVTGVRRRRRELAVLRAMGFVGRQVAATVAWQSTTLAAVGLAIGLPLGVALGRWSWSLVAGQIGVVVSPDVPLSAVALACAGAVVVANLVAALPARQASQLRPATALRAE